MSSDTWATVVAIDPGGTTGWSVIAVESDCLIENEISILASIVHKSQGQFDGDENDQTDLVMELYDAWPESARVSEDFSLRKFSRGRELLAPVRVIAKVEYALSVGEYLLDPLIYDGMPVIGSSGDGGNSSAGGGVRPALLSRAGSVGWPVYSSDEFGDLRLFYQSPGLAKSTVTDDRLKDWGLYIPGSQHARDATRHAITFLRRAKEKRVLRARAWPHLYG